MIVLILQIPRKACNRGSQIHFVLMLTQVVKIQFKYSLNIILSLTDITCLLCIVLLLMNPITSVRCRKTMACQDVTITLRAEIVEKISIGGQYRLIMFLLQLSQYFRLV